MANRLDQCQSNIVKYVTRFRDKGGLQDLLKARHYVDLLIHFEYGDEKTEEKSDREGPSNPEVLLPDRPEQEKETS